jgi:hypothetical protein
LRRKVVVITTLCLLVGAGAAYAAGSNVYTGTSMSFSKGVGTPGKPVGISFKQTLKAKSSDPTFSAGVLLNIKTRIYGLRADGKDFPTCSPNKMVALKSDSFCPKKSKAATGLVNAFLGDPSLTFSTRIPCNPDLDVFNGGQGKLWFFFTTHSATQCVGLRTGATAPYLGRISYQGKYEVTNIPLPSDIGLRVANHANFYSSLIHEQLTFFKSSTRVHGKTVFNNQSIGCLHGKRPWSITFTSTTNGHDRQVSTVSGSAKC